MTCPYCDDTGYTWYTYRTMDGALRNYPEPCQHGPKYEQHVSFYCRINYRHKHRPCIGTCNVHVNCTIPCECDCHEKVAA